MYGPYLVYFWDFCPFQFFIVPIYRAITKNVSESTCGKSRPLWLWFADRFGMASVPREGDTVQRIICRPQSIPSYFEIRVKMGIDVSRTYSVWSES